jgi:hypothetical protein
VVLCAALGASSFGRQRLDVLAALHATTLQLITVTNLTYINAATVCELLHRLAQEAPGSRCQ